jgi:anti-sigma factor RsiW
VTSSRPISEDDLHGFVDHQLDPARRSEVQTYLDAHPEIAARIAAFSRQREAVRAAAAPIADEPIPPQLNLRHVMEGRRRSQAWSWRAMAASVLLLVVGGAGGWSLRGTAVERSETSGIAALAQEAAYTFDVYGVDRSHPVEFGATDKAQLVNWIASRVGRTVSVPDLTASGYAFIGGRLVATPHGAAGLLMYSNALGQRLAMLVRPMAVDKDTRMSEHSYGDIHGFTWASKGTGFSVVGPAPADLLHPIADEIRRQQGKTI